MENASVRKHKGAEMSNHYNELIEYVKRLSAYDEPITKEDLYDELCFFADREKAYEVVYGEEQK